MRGRFGRLMRDQRAATSIEYGLIVALIFLAIVGAVVNFADAATNMWNNVADNVTNV